MTAGQIVAFQVGQPDHHVGNLHPGVVDVVLYIDALPRGAQQTHKGIAEDSVAQVTDVRSLVGIDAGVLDQRMEMALLFRRIVARDLQVPPPGGQACH